MSLFNPGNRVTFYADKQYKKGKVKEVTLWRRGNEIAYLVVEQNGHHIWLSEKRLKRGW